MTIEEIESHIDWFKNCVQQVERCCLSEEIHMIERMYKAKGALLEAIKQYKEQK